jgi:hypothetical protein
VDLAGVAVAHHVQVAQLHGPALLDHDGRLTPDGPQPVPHLLGVGDRRRQGDQGHRLRQVDDDLLPHRAAGGVLEVVDLVEHHVAQAGQRGRLRVDHVAQHLGGHHHHRGLAVDRVVAGEQADVVVAERPAEVAELLVRQRLQGRRVEDLAALGPGPGDGVLRDQRLARPGRRGDEDGLAVVEGVERPPLEGVEREAPGGLERVAHRVGARPPVRRPVGRHFLRIRPRTMAAS